MAREFIKPLVGTPTDYSKKENWMFLDEAPEYEVDTIYFSPTVSSDPDIKGGIIPICDATKAAAKDSYNMSGRAFEGYTNIFAPYYRQMDAIQFANKTIKEISEYAYAAISRTDVYAALDEYFTKYNNGRPYFFAGHSQGSLMIRLILEDYMKVHPEYLERMIAAYAIGFGFDGKYYSRNTQVLPAAGEIDTGVVISWNTEGPGAVKTNVLVNAPCCQLINPLTWTTDDSYGAADKNLGCLKQDPATGEYRVVKGYADAQIDAKRGTLICTTASGYSSFVEIFGDKSYHFNDYALYWENIRENGRKRIDAFMGSKGGRQNKMAQVLNDPEKLRKAKPIAIVAAILMIIIGIALFLDPVSTSTLFLWIVVIGVLVGGVEKIITYFQKPKGSRDGSALAIGILWVLAAILLLIGAIDHALMATAGLTWAIGILAGLGLMFAGIDQLTKSGQVKKAGGSQALCIVCGILELLCALFVITAPILGFVALNFVFGIFLIVYGVIVLVRAISIK